MEQAVPGFSDSVASAFAHPGHCPACGGMARIARGTCVHCLLETAIDPGEGSKEDFESILGEVDVPDQHWRLGNYQILGQIGRGGMGVIYRARQRHSQRIVALKRALGDYVDSHERLERFRREAEAAASLDHPNILPIYEVGETDEGFPFFSMKYATGGSLRDVGPALRNDPRACVQLMAKVSRAIEYAHGCGILHRDLQPGNILLDSHGEPMVSDFGLAKMLDDNRDLTQTLTTFGTPGFIAPEQAEAPISNLTAAADIYSLGAILFHLLAGRPPFIGATALSVLRKATDTPAPKLRTIVPAIDRDLETIVARCLEVDPEARYKSAGELASDLERWLDGRPILARRVLLPAQAWRWSRRNPAQAAIALACLLLTLAVVFLLENIHSSAGAATGDKSITVLPFANIDGNADTEFFSAGIQEDILTNLTKVAALKVISQTSVRGYEPNKPRDLRQIGAELGVAHVLEGAVRRSGDRIRVSARLRDTRTAKDLWSESYDRELRDVFVIQSEIAQKIADQLQAHLSPNEQANIRVRPTDDIISYELYLRAKEIGQRAGLSTAERTEKEVKLLEDALARDAAFVPALCLLARVHVFSYWSNHDHSPERLQRAHDALKRAAELTPDAGLVHLTCGIVWYWGHRDYEQALHELDIARNALPNDAEIPYFIGLIQRRQGKWDLSTRQFELARDKDPRNEIILFDLARTNYFALKRYREAAQTAEAVLVWKPDSFDFQLTRAKVDVSSQGDLRRWHEVVWGEPAKYADPELLAFERLDLSLTERNYRAAEAALAAQNLPEFSWAGYVTPRAYYEGLIARGLGDEARARAGFTKARDDLLAIVARRPDDAKAHIVLAQVLARLHDREGALREAERALELRPVTRDAVDGPNIMGLMAGICAQLGETNRALDLLETAAPMPNVTNYGALQLDDVWDSLRNDPRFIRVLQSLRPQTPAL